MKTDSSSSSSSSPALQPRDAGGGRAYGSNVHRIKSLFMQMGASPDPPAAHRPARSPLPRAGSLNERVDHGALLKLGAEGAQGGITSSISTSSIGSITSSISTSSICSTTSSKLQETRRIFERQQEEEDCAAAASRGALKKERAGGLQHGRLDVVARFNGSTESLDGPDAAEAVSPTVSQLSAVFERAAELRSNLHRLSRISTGRARPASAQEHRGTRKGRDPECATEDLKENRDATRPSVCEPHREANGEATEVGAARAGLAGSEVRGANQDGCPVEDGKEDDGDDDVTLKEDSSAGATLVEVSAYSAAGEDSGGSQLGDEDDEEEGYEPETACLEVPGLPAEEEPTPGRKIGFSTAPIKVGHADSSLSHAPPVEVHELSDRQTVLVL